MNNIKLYLGIFGIAFQIFAMMCLVHYMGFQSALSEAIK